MALDRLKKLASEIKGSDLTFTESYQLESKAKALKSVDKDSVTEILAESLGESERGIQVKIAAAYDDSDRILDDIVDELKKSN